ncbi:MAG: hypothetical protein GX383_05230 [Clostridium sp.]|nr:hypothetical protein [Clostridium sp.]
MKGLNSGLIRYNLKLIPKASLIVSVLLLLAIQAFFSLERADFSDMARIGETYVSILGIILIPGAAFIDENPDIKEIVYSKSVATVFPSIIRLIYLATILFFGIVVFVAASVMQGGNFNEGSIVAGVFISALLLGATGYLVGTFLNNIALSYLIPFGYYGLELSTKGKYTKGFYLFSLQNGHLQREKWILLTIAILFFVIGLTYMGNKKTCI